MTDKFKDFDEAIREVNDAKITFKVAGQTFDCPAQLPAKVVLTQLKMQNELGGIEKKDIGKNLEIIGECDDQTVEFFKHKKHRIYGIMWHPERYKNYLQLKKIINKIE